MHRDYMIDVEALSLEPDATLISFAVVEFDINTGDSEPLLAIGIKDWDNGHIDPDTVKWWFQQSKEAQQSVLHNPDTLKNALLRLNDVMDGSVSIWSHTIDMIWLRNAFERCGLIPEWSYKQERDIRPIVDLSDRLGYEGNGIAAGFTAHSAG